MKQMRTRIMPTLALSILLLFSFLPTSAQETDHEYEKVPALFLRIAGDANMNTDTKPIYIKDGQITTDEANSQGYLKKLVVGDTVKLRIFLTSNNKLNLGYDVVKKGNEWMTEYFIVYDNSGNFSAYGKGLYSGKGITMQRGFYNSVIKIYDHGRKVGPTYYGKTGSWSNMIIVFEEKGKSGLLHMNGEFVLPLKYYSLKEADGLLIAAMESHEYGVLDTKGNVIVPLEYDEVIASGKLFRVRDGFFDNGFDGKYGFYNRQGQLVTPVEYKYIMEFSDGMAGIRKDGGKYGFVDETGKLVIPLKYYDIIEGFKNGKAKVKLSEDEGSFYINKRGEKVD